MTLEASIQHKSGRFTRLLASLSLCGVVSGMGYLGHTTYRAVNDSFVAPMILSPDSDIVVENKLKMTEIYLDRARAIGEMDGIDGDLAADEKAIARLTALRTMAEKGLTWTRDINARQGSAGAAELAALTRQKAMLTGMLVKQRELANRARANMEMGLISMADYSKEVHSVNQTELALLENGRTTAQSELSMYEVTLGQSSIDHTGAPPMPELITREDQLVRLELELLRLDAEKHSKTAERKAISVKISVLNDLEAQLKNRPVFLAVDKSLDVAFVPYTQIVGVTAGAEVYACVWGFFGCKAVGTVTEVLPGEVQSPDPWGNAARGQYAVLNLKDHEQAKAKVLHVRAGDGVPVSRELAATMTARAQ